MRMRDLLLAKWRNRAKQAAVAAGSAVAAGASVSASLGPVDRIMNRWDDDVGPRYAIELEKVYKLARTAGFKKASGQTKASLQYTTPNFTEVLGDLARVKVEKAKLARALPSFDVMDDAAIAALHDDQMLWIGKHYKTNVSKTIRTSVTGKLTAGLGRAEAGRAIRGAVERELDKVVVPDGFRGSQAKYFEGLAANAATVGRVRGQIRSFIDLGVTRYEIVNPKDKRTSVICSHLAGKVFLVEHGRRQIESEAGATKPDDIKKAHPWKSIGEIKAIAPKAGDAGPKQSAALAKNGLSQPPYHFRCRSTVDVSTNQGAITSEERAGLGPAPKPRPVPKPGKLPKPTTKPKPAAAATKPATLPVGLVGGPARAANTKQWANSLNREKREAFTEWSQEGYIDIREVDLLGPKKFLANDIVEGFFEPEDAIAAHKAMIEALETAPIHQGTIHRGLSNIQLKDMKQFQKGGTMELKSISSFTRSRKAAEGFAVPPDPVVDDALRFVTMEVKVSGRTLAHDIEALSLAKVDEAEVVVMKGSKFKIKTVKNVKGVHLVLEEEPLGATVAAALEPSIPSARRLAALPSAVSKDDSVNFSKALGRAITKRNGPGARAAMQKMLKDNFGIATNSKVVKRARLLYQSTIRGANGAAGAEGTILIRESVRTGAIRDLKNFILGKKSTTTSAGLNTFIHEEIHHTINVASQQAFIAIQSNPAALYVEEVATELAAREVGAKLGYKALAASSYQRSIDDMVKTVAKIGGMSVDEAADTVTVGALAFRHGGSAGLPAATNSHKHIDNFVEAMPVLTKSQKTQLRKALDRKKVLD
jgi:hypothetical protein